MDKQALAHRFEVAEALGDPRERMATQVQQPAGVSTSASALVLLAPPSSLRVRGFYERFVKRALDVLVCAVLSVLVLPLLLVIGLTLYVTMGSPVIFRQQRVGLNGEVFTILKFRTMLPDRRRSTEEYYGLERRQRHKSPDDPRVTPIGKFLRKWSIDELPQLWNVLRGDMTLVGPRPELVEIVARYQPWQRQRHAVKPGVTGLWQVSGLRDGLMHEHVEIDIDYISRMSFMTDMRILLCTISAVLGKSVGY